MNLKYYDEFNGFENIAKCVSKPPEKVQKVKPSKEDMSLYLFGKVPAKPLPKRYSYSKIKIKLRDQYNCKLIDVTGYKGTRGDNPRKVYSVVDEKGNTIVEEVNLYQLGSWLEKQGDYNTTTEEILDTTDFSNRYKADVYYLKWYQKSGKTRPYGKYMRDVFVEESDGYYKFFDMDGNYLFKKRLDSEGTKIIRKDKFENENNHSTINVISGDARMFSID